MRSLWFGFALLFALSAFAQAPAVSPVPAAASTGAKPIWNGYIIADGRLSGDGYVLVCPALDDKMRAGGDCQRGMYPKYTIEPALKLTLQQVLDRQPARPMTPGPRVAVGVGPVFASGVLLRDRQVIYYYVEQAP